MIAATIIEAKTWLSELDTALVSPSASNFSVAILRCQGSKYDKLKDS
jgi:hypothetical protein